MTERGLRTKMNPVDDYARVNVFDFCSELFGEMRHLTEEEKQLYRDMLERKTVWRSTMNWEEAIEYCETHKCEDCIASTTPDCRTAYEKESLHAPCCINLVDEDLRYE